METQNPPAPAEPVRSIGIFKPAFSPHLQTGANIIGSLSKIEATASLILVGQMAQTQGPQWFDKDKLEESEKAADEFISKRSLEKGVAVVKYIYKETPPETASIDRRRKWTGWEI